MTPSVGDRSLIDPYVSSASSNVFALMGLPEEVIAVLFAYYSRSRLSLRENLARLLSDQALGVTGELERGTLKLAEEKARTFHEKWVVGYGHASVAEHAVIHLALEAISIVASKEVEDCRLAAYTEKSTRYVVFDQDSFVSLENDLPEELHRVYYDAAHTLLQTYDELMPRVQATLERQHATADYPSPAARTAAIRAQACDILRYLLPAGTLTHIGLTINGRALEHHLRKLNGSALPEVRRLAQQMRQQAAHVVPTLVKYVEPPNHVTGRRARLDPHIQAQASHTVVALHRAESSEVRLLHTSDDALRRICMAVAYEAGHGSARQTETALDAYDLEQMFAAYVADRGPFDAPGRALEQASYTFDVVLDEGAYRDLQRHRMQTQTRQMLGFWEGYELPGAAHALDVASAMEAAIEVSFNAWKKLATHNEALAQYVVPLAARRRYMLTCNLREFYQMVELRSARQGHASYRRVAQQLWAALREVHPWAAEHLRVDLNDYELARA